MRAPILAFVVAPSLLLAAGCAASRPPQPLDNNPRSEVVAIPGAAEQIPLYAERGLPGCTYRIATELASSSLMGLQDQAYQMQADAVVGVRQQMQVNARARGESAQSFRPAAAKSYTGIAVRFDTPGCRGVTARGDEAGAAS